MILFFYLCLLLRERVGDTVQSQHFGFWLWWLRLLWSMGSRHGGFSSFSSCGAGALVGLQHVGSCQTEDWTLISCIGTSILYYWATREPHLISLICCVFVFSCFKIFLNFPLISSLIHWFPEKCCLISTYLTIVVGKDTSYNFSLLKFAYPWFGSSIWSILENVSLGISWSGCFGGSL